MEKYSSLTIKYLMQHKGRTLLTLFGIIVAIAMFTAISTFYYSGLNSEIERTKQESGNYEAAFIDVSIDKLKILKNNAEIKNGGTEKEVGKLQISNVSLTESLKSLNVKAYDEDAFKNIFIIKLSEGRLPQNSSEIIVDSRFYNVLKTKNSAEVLKGTIDYGKGILNKEYKIVGAFQSEGVQSIGITALDNELLKDGIFKYRANMKAEKEKMKFIEKVAVDAGVNYEANTHLLLLYGESPNKDSNDALRNILIIVIAFVVICTVVVIYNAFNISVMERIKHYGILRSIGATKSQIRNLVFREAAIMSVISIPLGILSGYYGIYITFKLMGDAFLGNFNIVFNPIVIVIGAVLGLITIFLSALLPARTASKVSPVDAMRGNAVLQGEKIKKRRSFFAGLLFNFEGEVAYKNIKRSRKRFYITCISLTISIIIFIFFSTFIDLLLESYKTQISDVKIEGFFQPRNGETEVKPMDENFINTLKSTDGISKVYKTNLYYAVFPLDKDKLQNNFSEALKNAKRLKEYKDQYLITRSSLVSYDENAFNLTKEKNNLKFNYSDLNNNKVIIVNKSRGTNSNKTFYGEFTKYKVGDKINIPIVDKEYLIKEGDDEKLKTLIEGKKYITFEVAGVIEKDILVDTYLDMSFGMILSDDCFRKITGINGYNAVGINYSSLEYSEKLFDKLNAIGDENNLRFYDIYKMAKEYKQVMNQLSILAYGFVTLIVLISTVNIFNTVTINLMVKKREYAVFKAIGMTKGQFRKLVLLEGTLFGIFSTLFGIPISFGLMMLIISNNPLGDIGYNTAIWPYICGAAGIIFITYVAALIPLRKLNDMNIIEGLRIEE